MCFVFKQKTAYEMRISDWSSDVCSSDLSGRGEALRAGARVVKNVTGYDLPKLAAGSWGRLFAMTEVTLKVLPRPLCRSTRVIAGLNPDQAVRAMAAALGSQAEVAAAAHIPAHLRGGTALTGLRIQGRTEEHTSELQSLMRISYAVFC